MIVSKMVDCRPVRQTSSNGQLDYLSGKDDYPTICRCCHVKLPMMRKPNEIDICTSCNDQLIVLDEDAYPIVTS